MIEKKGVVDLSATIKDVAKEAGVSVATVSRVLNGSATVSEENRSAVYDAVKILGYEPNSLGRNLRMRKTGLLLVIMPSSEHSLYMKICSGMESCARKRGYEIITASSGSSSEGENSYLSMLFNRTVDGAVLMGTSLDAERINSLAERFDIALCGEGVTGADVLTVTVDDEQAGYDACRALLDLGHTRIGFIGVETNALSGVLREKGFMRALRDASLEPACIFRGTYDFKNGAAAMESFLAMPEPPTAVFAVSDMLALSASRRAYELGYTVGRDISVMGFDNISISELTVPGLSTVEQPCVLMGEMVCGRLLDNISRKEKDRSRCTAPHRVILRESVRGIG